ncbi:MULTISPECIES: hypothetical protein [Providencia]|uniref:Uncharacterized protein n=1 Tax=Providencia hangzhouensis TaxID=3031799 RepID=A0ABY9Z6X4_9GAMM|nr:MULTISPECIES: hypothetical protein [Providencia]MBN6364989.1 hypothetical protein [Providencia rettgeri]WNK23500.1 hypothetical protein PZ638_16420 [Providencia hangzhouensis]
MKSQDILILLKIISMHIDLNRQNFDSDTFHLYESKVDWGDMFERQDASGESSADFSLAYVDDDVLVVVEDEDEWTEKGLKPSYNEESAIKSRFSVRNLEFLTGISKSQISLGLNRMYDVGLAKPDRRLAIPKVNTKALFDFIAFGIKYVFPAKEGELTRGIATSIAAPVLKGKLMTSGEFPLVWPDPRGKTKGFAIEPLHSNIIRAVQLDSRLYAMLALVDAVRIGRPREHNLSLEKLKIIFEEVK